MARRFNAALVRNDGVPFTALAEREGVSRSYFTRLVRLSYLAPDIVQAILDGRQPRDLTPDKLLAHSRLPIGWHEQRTALGFACAGLAVIQSPPHRHCGNLLVHSRLPLAWARATDGARLLLEPTRTSTACLAQSADGARLGLTSRGCSWQIP